MRLRVIWKNGWAHLDGTGPDGRRIRRALKTRDPKRAEEARAHEETRLWKVGLYGAESVVTFDEAALAYVEGGGESRFIVPVAKALHGMRLRDITEHDIHSGARKAYPKATNATRNRQFVTPARAVISFSSRNGWCPLIKVEPLQTKRIARKSVKADYLVKLAPHLPPRAYALALFLHTTGRRVSDAIDLEPGDVDVEARTALIRDPKNGEPITAHLTPQVAELIAGLEPRHGRVFGYAHRSSLYGTLRRACEKAGVEYLGTHQIGRHSFNTTLHDAGFSIADIGKASGAKSLRLLAETYIHPSDSGERAAKVFDTILSRRKICGAQTS